MAIIIDVIEIFCFILIKFRIVISTITLLNTALVPYNFLDLIDKSLDEMKSFSFSGLKVGSRGTLTKVTELQNDQFFFWNILPLETVL